METAVAPDFIVVDGGEGAPGLRRSSSPITLARHCRKR